MNIKFFTVFYYTCTLNVALISLAKFASQTWHFSVRCVCRNVLKVTECDPQHHSSSPILDGLWGLLSKICNARLPQIEFWNIPPTTTFQAIHVKNVVCIIYTFYVCLCLKYIKYLKVHAVQDISMFLLSTNSVLDFYCWVQETGTVVCDVCVLFCNFFILKYKVWIAWVILLVCERVLW
jgi:hypothetical protein